MERTEWRLDLSKLEVGREGFDVKVCTGEIDNCRFRNAQQRFNDAQLINVKLTTDCQRMLWNFEHCKVNALRFSFDVQHENSKKPLRIINKRLSQL